MNMAETVIRISATTEQLDQTLSKVEDTMVSSGEQAAKTWSEKFGSYLDRAKGSLSQKLQKSIEPQGIVNGLNKAFEQLNQGGGIMAAIEGLISSVPVFGAAYNLGKAIGTSIARAIDDSEEIAAALKSQTAQMQREVDALNKERDRETRVRAGARGAEGALESGQFATRIAEERALGNERQAVFLEYQKREAEITRQTREKMMQAQSDEERSAIEALAVEERRQNQLTIEARYKELQRKDEEAAKRRRQEEEKIARETGDDAVEMFRKQQEEQDKLAKQAERDAEALAKRKKEYDEEAMRLDAEFEERRMTAQRAGMQSANTALGTFTFDAYTDTEKKQNDEAILDELQIMNRQLVGSFGFT